MTIPRNDQLKSSIVAKLKADTVVTTLLTDTEEIREVQWQGTIFSYPNIRVRVVENSPDKNGCAFTNARMGIMVFSEDDSSQEADQIAGIIANQLHTQSFTSQSIKFTLYAEKIIPAIRRDDNVWVSEVILNGTANG